MVKYLRMYEEGLGFMKSLKRFMDWSRKEIKNKRDLAKLEKIYEKFMEDNRGMKRDYYLFRNYILENKF